MIRCYSLDIPVQYWQMTVWLGENPEPRNVSYFWRLEISWDDVVQVLRLSSQESSSWNNIGVGFWQVERNWSRRETTQRSRGGCVNVLGVGMVVVGCGCLHFLLMKPTNRWHGFFGRVFGVDIFLPQSQTAANQWFWYKKTTSKRHQESSTYPSHVFVHPNFPPSILRGSDWMLVVGMMGFRFLQEFRKEVTKALPGYYVFFDDTALHVTWAWRNLGYLDDEIPTKNFDKGNHGPCQCIKKNSWHVLAACREIPCYFSRV